jgi:glycerophosphoryl diester phosphodiesterase
MFDRRTLLAGSAALMATAASKAKPARPIIIGHRGASADRPEHTLAAYSEAIAQGADFIEPDLVMTSDGVLVARHENEISSTTDVGTRPEFANRRTAKVIDGTSYTGWFVEDFTFAELKTLRAMERIPDLRPQNVQYSGQFEVPSFAEIIALAKVESQRLGRPIGLYPETKHPSYHHRLGLPQEKRLVQMLHQAGFSNAQDPVFIQSFEIGNLRELRSLTKLKLIQLVAADGVAEGSSISYADMMTAAGLQQIATYAHGIGAPKQSLAQVSGDGQQALTPTPLIKAAHDAGLLVHGWTFRPILLKNSA